MRKLRRIPHAPDVSPALVRETWERFRVWRDAFTQLVREDPVFRLFAMTYLKKWVTHGRP